MVTSLEYNPRYCRKEYTREEKELPIRKKCEWMEFTRQELRRMGWKEWDEGNGDADGIDYLISLVNGPWKRVMLRLVIDGNDCLLMMQYMFWNRWFFLTGVIASEERTRKWRWWYWYEANVFCFASIRFYIGIICGIQVKWESSVASFSLARLLSERMRVRRDTGWR